MGHRKIDCWPLFCNFSLSDHRESLLCDRLDLWIFSEGSDLQLALAHSKHLYMTGVCSRVKLLRNFCFLCVLPWFIPSEWLEDTQRWHILCRKWSKNYWKLWTRLWQEWWHTIYFHVRQVLWVIFLYSWTKVHCHKCTIWEDRYSC